MVNPICLFTGRLESFTRSSDEKRMSYKWRIILTEIFLAKYLLNLDLITDISKQFANYEQILLLSHYASSDHKSKRKSSKCLGFYKYGYVASLIIEIFPAPRATLSAGQRITASSGQAILLYRLSSPFSLISLSWR